MKRKISAHPRGHYNTKYLRDYSQNFSEAHERAKIHGKLIRSDFITEFRPNTIHSLNRPMVTEGSENFDKRCVYVDYDRYRDTTEAIIDLLFS